jgi:hypothetical protein
METEKFAQPSEFLMSTSFLPKVKFDFLLIACAKNISHIYAKQHRSAA